jgi:hypothetical protein
MQCICLEDFEQPTEKTMAGYVNERRDLDEHGKPMPYTQTSGFVPYVYAPNSGAVQESAIPSLIAHQRTFTYRDGGTNGSRIEDYHQILANNQVQFFWPFDNGHEFRTLKVSSFKHSHPDFTARGGRGAFYRGPIMAMDPVPFWTGHNSPTGNDRVTVNYPQTDITIGTKYLRSTVPNKSAANLSQMIIEIMIDMPRIPFDRFDQKLYDRRNLPKNIGSEYLNTVFGWAPLVSDVLKVCEAIVKIDDNLRQYRNDSADYGKTVRRRRGSDPVRTSSSTVVDNYIRLGFPYGPYGLYDGEHLFMDASGNYPTQANGYPSTRGTLTHTIETYEKYDFVSRWMYYFGQDQPGFNKLRHAADLARKLLGLRLDLELLWELAPWSWFADWFVNIGDVLAVNQAISQDDQVLQYAYLMHETKVQYEYHHTGVLFGGTKYSGPITSLFVQRTKERVRATPYGFGVNLNGLNPVQIAILGSLAATGGTGGTRY